MLVTISAAAVVTLGLSAGMTVVSSDPSKATITNTSGSVVITGVGAGVTTLTFSVAGLPIWSILLTVA